MKVRFLSRKVLLTLLFIFILVGCTKGVVPNFSVLNSGANQFPFIDGGFFDGNYPYLVNPSKTPALASFNNQLYLVSVTGFSNGISTYLYNGNDSVPFWTDYGSFSFQSPRTATSPGLTVLNSNLYATWAELNSGSGISQIQVGSLNGLVWAPADGSANCGGVTCLNNNATQNATFPAIASVNSNLVVVWSEMFSGFSNIYGAYSSNNGSSWTFTGSLNAIPTEQALSPQVVGFGPDAYIAWAENSQIHMTHSPNGAGLTNIDPALATINSGEVSAQSPFLAVNNGSLYLSWIANYGGASLVRVAVFNGVNNWSFVDTGFLNFNSSFNAVGTQKMLNGPDNNLYITWTELNSAGVAQVRVARFNGGNTWSSVSGATSTDLNFNTANNAFDPSLTIFNGNVYSSWEEQGGQDLSRVMYLF